MSRPERGERAGPSAVVWLERNESCKWREHACVHVIHLSFRGEESPALPTYMKACALHCYLQQHILELLASTGAARLWGDRGWQWPRRVVC
jgi:hypothetical protein